jgi:hypothetical protein
LHQRRARRKVARAWPVSPPAGLERGDFAQTLIA